MDLNNANIPVIDQTKYALRLLELLAQESGLEQIVEMGYEMLGNPFSINDMSNKCIAITSPAQLNDDPVWNEVVTSGYTSFTSWSFYVSNKLVELVDKNESPFFWTDTYSKYPRIMGSIKISNKQIACIAVCAHERPFQESDLELTSLLCKALSIELQKNEFIHYSRGLLHEGFTEDLLEGKVTDEKVVSERLRILNLKFKRNLFVLTIDISNFSSSQTSLTFMRNEFEKKINNSKAVVYAEKIVMIISCDNEKHFLKNEITSLKEFLKSNNMYAGISRCFYSLVEVQHHYFQSLNALKLGMHINKEAVLFSYEDYAIYHFTDQCSSGGDLKENCHPALLRLIEYDRQNNTNYTRSLYTYILSSKNVTESASTLNIHRNTMFYRIGKIEDVMNVDLNNSNILLLLHLSFKILEFLKIPLP
ncbi:PucR family transcriptional regulator [Desulfosporosinus fructosivorans]